MFIYIGFILAGVSVVSLGVMFCHTYRDPRWRVFNFHSRLATEAEIYNVSENPVISKVRQMVHMTDDARQRMGSQGRGRMRRDFSEKLVIQRYVDTVKRLGVISNMA